MVIVIGALVKWLRLRPLTAASRVRIPYASPIDSSRLEHGSSLFCAFLYAHFPSSFLCIHQSFIDNIYV